MASSPHRIRRQQFLVSTDTTEQAFRLRKQFREQWEDMLLPVLEKAFDEISVDDQILHIPRIEIKLKVGQNSDLWESLPKELYNEIIKQLRPFTVKKTKPLGGTGSWSEIPEHQHQFDALIHYLKQGNLPWQLSVLSSEESSLKLRETIQNRWPQLLVYLYSSSFSEASYFRLFQLLTDEQSIEFVKDFSGKISPFWKDDLKNILIGLFNSGDTIFNKYTRLSLAATFLAAGLKKEDQNLFPDLTTKIELILSPEKLIDFQHFIASLHNLSPMFRKDERERRPYIRKVETEENPSSDFMPVAEVDELAPDFMPVADMDELAPDFMPGGGKKTQSPGVSIVEGKEETSSTRRTVDGNPKFTDEYSDISESMAMSQYIPLNNLQNTPRIKVQYAGLVLLHPFIYRFFVHTGILEDQRKDIPFFKLPRAAALMHFLATGSTEIYEFELGFIKLLLGMDTEQSLPVSEGLISQQDKEEAESLLQSVISHWYVLKNTSIDGLRTSFLQRNALLHQTEEGWMLQMETASFDMLINQLPWSFTIIKLPWMKKPIFTEWETI